jgi:hypothetical protein
VVGWVARDLLPVRTGYAVVRSSEWADGRTLKRMDRISVQAPRLIEERAGAPGVLFFRLFDGRPEMRLRANHLEEIRKVIASTQGTYGDLQAVTGRSLAALPALEPPLDGSPGANASESANA